VLQQAMALRTEALAWDGRSARHRSVNSPTRVMLVVNSVSFLVSHRLNLALAAREAGYDVELVTGVDSNPRDTEASARLLDARFVLHRVPLSRAGRNPLQELTTYRALRSLYDARTPELVHHVTVKSIMYGTLAARYARVPAVVNAVSGLGHLFLDESWRGRVVRSAALIAYRRAVRHPNLAMLFQNADDAQLFRQSRLGTEGVQVLIPGSGVDLNVWHATSEPDGVPVVMLPARMLREKGIYEFVAAARLLREQRLAARFVLVGDTDENPTSVPVEQLIKWQREGCVEWWGHRTDMPAVIAAAAIVCLPSYREGMPKALLEAAAAAKPIVTTDVPGCRDCVTPESGLLVRPRDGASLASSLRQLLVDPQRRVRMGVAARAKAEREFSSDSVAHNTLAIYSRLLMRSPRPA
jgi:glycosyltransferase involved in cell wall biosynthesis